MLYRISSLIKPKESLIGLARDRIVQSWWDSIVESEL